MSQPHGVFMHGIVPGSRDGVDCDVPALGIALMSNDQYLAPPRHWRWLAHLVAAMAQEMVCRVFTDGGYHHTRGLRIIPRYVAQLEAELAGL